MIENRILVSQLVNENITRFRRKTPNAADEEISISDFKAVGDGITDDINAFFDAMSYLDSIGGGVLNLESGKTYAVSGGIPAVSNVTINMSRSSIKLIQGSVLPMIYYNSSETLTNFNIVDGILDGNNVAQNIINVTEPSPAAPNKTWSYSVLFNVEIKNSGSIGLYCPIPGRVRMIGCYVHHNDIGLAWDREHLDVYNSSIEQNRIGIRSTGNHFVWIHGVVAHNSEKGWTTEGAGLGTYTNVYEGAFLGCTFIDNGSISLEGLIDYSRIEGSRFLDASTHIKNARGCMILGNQFGGEFDYAIDDIGNDCIINGNRFANGVNGVRTKTTTNGIQIVNNFFSILTGQPIRLVNPLRLDVKDNSLKSITGTEGIYIDANSNVTTNFTVSGNRLSDIAGVGIKFVGPTSGDVNDWHIDENYIWNTDAEAIRCEGTTASYGSSISRNKIVDANMNNVAGTHAIYTSRIHAYSLCCNNIIRNTGSGKADHAIFFANASGTDLLFDGNVARNMLGTYSYDLPLSAVVGDNVGTFAP